VLVALSYFELLLLLLFQQLSAEPSEYVSVHWNKVKDLFNSFSAMVLLQQAKKLISHCMK